MKNENEKVSNLVREEFGKFQVVLMSGSRNINRPGKKLLQNLTPSLVYVYYCILLHIFDRLNI